MSITKKEKSTETKIAYTVVEAAHASASSRTSLFAAIKAGHLKARKNGRRTVILDGDLRAWLAKLPARQVA